MLMLLDIINFLLTVLTYVIIVQWIVSLLVAFNVVNTYNDFVRQLLHALSVMTEPLYRPIRRILPDFGQLDFAPLIVLLIIRILQSIVIPRLAMGLATSGMAF